VLIAETERWDEKLGARPGYRLPNGAVRSTYPTSEAAVRADPTRFAYIGHVDRRDPDIAEVIGELRTHPGRLGLRVVARRQTGEWDQLVEGGYGDYFALAREHGVPCFVYCIAGPLPLRQYIERFGDNWFIIDHLGLSFLPPMPTGPERYAGLEQTLSLAEYPNVALKWCHAPELAQEEYPYPTLSEQLKRAVDAFGPERIMFGSDYTEIRASSSWADAFYYIKDSTELSRSDKDWILGGSLRTILNWDRE
jgi:predicted TIM-barrel fold metal-dependent hydrolase